MTSEHAFVLHTADPFLSEEKERYMYAELVRGQGETLASGTQGTPYRLRIEKATGKVEILAFWPSKDAKDSAPEMFHSEMEMFQTKITRLEAPLTQASSLTIIGSRML